MQRVTLLLCIENRIYCEGLKKLLSDQPEVARVRTFDSIDGLAARPKGVNEAVLVDIRSEYGGDGAAGVRAAFAWGDGRPIVALGLEADDIALLASVEAGAAACITADQSIEDLLGVVVAVLAGELVCPPRIGRMMQERLLALSAEKRETERLSKLSQREHHVLSLLTERMSNKQIARTLGLEVSTIKNHVHNIIVKLDVRNRTEAVALFRGSRQTGGMFRHDTARA